MSKYGVISSPYFPVFGLNTGKYGPEITPYLDTFHAVTTWLTSSCNTHIAQHLSKERQTDNEIWSVDRTKHEIFSYKNNAKYESRRPVPELFLFF